MSVALHFGDACDVESARQAAQLLDLVSDPSVRCSFRSVFSYALGLGADYEMALRVAEEAALRDATMRRFRIDLRLRGRSPCPCGLAQVRRIHEALGSSLSAARDCTDAAGEQNVYAATVRLLLQEHRFADACALEPPDASRALPGLRGEVIVSRGLALACIGRGGDALALADEASRMTQCF